MVDVIPTIVKLIKVLSSVSCQSPVVLAMLKSVFNDEYTVKILRLLKEVPDKTVLWLLHILRDFYELKLPFASGSKQDEFKIDLGSYLASSLLEFARTKLLAGSYDTCIQTCRLLQAIPV